MAALFDLGYPASEYKSHRPSYRGTSLQTFHARFPDEEACIAHVFKVRYGLSPTCPKCGRAGRWYRIAGTKRFQHPCGQGIWPLTGTLFERSNIPLQLWFYALLHFANSTYGVPSTFLGRHIGLSTKAAFRMVDRIRTHMAALDFERRVGSAGNPVEVRIEYLAGIRTAGYPVRGSAKAVILGDAHSVQATLIGRARRHVLSQIIRDKCTPGVIPVTSCAYTHSVLGEFGTRTPGAGFVRDPIKTGAGTNPIRSFLIYLKRPMHETYRRVDYANLWKYLKEFEFSFNRRTRSHEIFDDLVARFPDISPGRSALLEAWSSRAAPTRRTQA
ncbi:IS1595 family transposase [Aurantiacibacter hainanensis]|uniref:IS1595 family transposase n=1 Tax=Aurantiacibacter hainanensis TaxID=3076114 RepID=UPI0030C688F9